MASSVVILFVICLVVIRGNLPVKAASSVTDPGSVSGTGEVNGTSWAPEHGVLSPGDDHLQGGNVTDHEVDGNHTEHPVHRYPVVKFDFKYVGAPLVISLWVVLASGAKIFFHLNNKLSSIFPESCLLILLGVLLGVIMFLSNVQGYTLSSGTFFIYLLPPIILEAGYFMPNRSFFDNIGSILVYAVIGTLFNAVMIGVSIWGFSQSGGIGAIPMKIGLLQCLTLGTLLAAVDPVAVLAVFEEVHVNEILHIVVFGESLLNDGVTVVLYHMFEGFTEIGPENLIFLDIVYAFVSFLLVVGCGTLIGVFFGLLAAFISRFTDHVRVIEPILVFVMGYLSYLTAELFHFSGILACTFCGITMRRYIEANVSPKSRITIKYFMKMLASICETIIFMFLGISTVVDSHAWDTAFILLTLLFCLIYRTIGVICLTAIANRFRLIKLSKVDQFVMAYGGLRGAIAFSLVVLLDKNLFPQKNLFLTTTVVVVYFTVFIQGTTIKPLVNLLRVKRATKQKATMNEQIHGRLFDHLMAGIEDVTGHFGHHELRRKYEHINEKYLKRLLIKEKANKARGWSILNIYQKLNERDTRDILRCGSLNDLQGNPALLTSYPSLARLFNPPRDSGDDLNSDHEEASTVPLPLTVSASGTCLDLAAMESQNSRKMRDDSKIHHIVEDNMFKPRRRFTRHLRHMLPESFAQPFHHNTRLHLRNVVSQSHHRKHHHHNNETPDPVANGHVVDPDAAAKLAEGGKVRKNVSFARVTSITDIPDADDVETGSTLAVIDNQSDVGDSLSCSSDSENGIVFTATGNPDHHDDLDTSKYIPQWVEPTEAEKTLPWKRTTGREGMSSSASHTLPDDAHPVMGEMPSWVNNLDYTSAGNDMQISPSIPKLDDQRKNITHDGDDGLILNLNGAASEGENNVVTDSEEHVQKAPVMSLLGGIEEGEGQENIAFTNVSSDEENKAAEPKKVVRPAEPEREGEEDNVDGPIPPPWRTNTPNDLALDGYTPPAPWRAEEESQGPPLPWRSEGDEPQGPPPPRRSEGEEPQGPPPPWRSEGALEEPQGLPPPWRSEGALEEPQGLPPPWKTPNDLPQVIEPKNHSVDLGDEGLPPPWRRNDQEDCHVVPIPDCHSKSNNPWNSPARHYPSNSTPLEIDGIQDTIPPPWRDNSGSSVCLDGCAPRPCKTPLLPELVDGGYIPPVPWRQNSNETDPIRSPSVSHDLDLYSVRPQMSTQSFRLSEAESRHSEPAHVHHKIELPHRPHVTPEEDAAMADVEHEEGDLYDRVNAWLADADPEPFGEGEELTIEIPASPTREEVDCVHITLEDSYSEQESESEL